ncbi:cytochrome P450 4C1-like isoform X2 [Anoplophora glabripennis]|uniref:cytochrome P450 4C1-like isoform X2 n=1 Tax=Anoplophora glabripennis TaxID=217634 RepID=UPI0008754E47|nr:cytochrome P450 4C1-like isoform X2 [Anoplophora glabripennis]
MWSTPVLIAAATLLFFIYKRIVKSSRFWRCIAEIPGPKGKPVVGNLFDVMKTPEQLFVNRRKWAKEFYPIYKTQCFGKVFVSIMSPEDAEKVINVKVHERKGSGYDVISNWLGNGLLHSHGQKWKSRRKILTPAFHFSILQEFVSIFNKEAEGLIGELMKHCDEPYIDVLKPVTEFTLCSIIETSMGIHLYEQKSSESYKNAVTDLGEIMIYRIVRPWLLVNPIYKLSKVHAKEKEYLDVLHNFSESVIAERKKTFDINHNSYSVKKRRAMLDLMLQAQQTGADIDDAGLREEVDTFLFGGHDTTSMAICFALMALANEKRIQEDIYNEIIEVLGDSGRPPTYSDLLKLSFMERCIKETLRLYPSIPMINRISGADIKTHSGYTIPKGTDINIYIYDIHRNADVWENPTKFDPDRFLPENIAKRHPFSFIPFSAGSRNCIGQKYGLCEIKAALCGILRKFQLEPVDTPETLKYKSDIVLRSAKEIKVKFVPRK